MSGRRSLKEFAMTLGRRSSAEHPSAMSTLGVLGAVPPGAAELETTSDQTLIWHDFLLTMADEIENATLDALHAYDSMRDVLDTVGQPLFQDAASYLGVPVTWTKELDQKLLDLGTMGETAAGWLRQAAVGGRELVIQGDAWGIAAKDSDPFHIEIDAQNQLAMIAGDQSVHTAPGTLGGVPVVVGGVAVTIPWIVVAVGLVAQLAIQGFILYLLYTAIVAMRDVILGIVHYWSERTWADCVKNAKDPKDCLQAQKGILLQTEAYAKDKAPGIGADAKAAADAFEKAAKAALWLALGGAVIYLGVKTVPPLLEELQKRKAPVPV